MLLCSAVFSKVSQGNIACSLGHPPSANCNEIWDPVWVWTHPLDKACTQAQRVLLSKELCFSILCMFDFGGFAHLTLSWIYSLIARQQKSFKIYTV